MGPAFGAAGKAFRLQRKKRFLTANGFSCIDKTWVEMTKYNDTLLLYE